MEFAGGGGIYRDQISDDENAGSATKVNSIDPLKLSESLRCERSGRDRECHDFGNHIVGPSGVVRRL